MFKKILSLLLAISMLICMSACGTKDTVSDITSDIAPDETTQSQIEEISSRETTDNTESKVSTPISTTPSQTQSAVQPTPQPQHTHSYTTTVRSATCTEQGYTTYTCSCGDTYNAEYITPSHKYDNYRCSVCGAVDKEHTYEYLANWIIKNGKTDGQHSKITHIDENGGETSLIYQAQDNLIFIERVSKSENDLYYMGFDILDINDMSNTSAYLFGWKDMQTQKDKIIFAGEINKNIFTDQTPITYKDYSSDIGMEVNNYLLEYARLDINVALIFVDGILCGKYGSLENSGLTILDLGFISYVYEE